MPKTSARLYTATPPLGASVAQAAITVTAAKLRCVAVDAPSEGRLVHLSVKQTGGTGVGYTIELLMSSVPYPVGEAAVATAAVGTIELFRVVAQQAATSGNAIELKLDPGRRYINMDGNPTVNVRSLYLVIIPTGAATTTTWDVGVIVANDVGGI